MVPSTAKYKRILLKISGESFGTKQAFEMSKIHEIASEIAATRRAGVEIGIVVGGGNIVRGATLQQAGIDRTVGDSMGMLATVVNGLALENILQNLDIDATVMTSRTIEGMAESYNYQRCLDHFKKGRVVIFAGGTGSPFFTTDTAAALKSVEIKADIFFKATKVDGVYEADPKKVENAKKFDVLTYQQILSEQYRVMDATAVAFCRENNMPLLVFNLMEPGNLLRAVSGEQIGTLIEN